MFPYGNLEGLRAVYASKPLVKRRVFEFAEILLETLPKVDASNPAAEKVASLIRERAERARQKLERYNPTAQKLPSESANHVAFDRRKKGILELGAIKLLCVGDDISPSDFEDVKNLRKELCNTCGHFCFFRGVSID